MLMVPDSVVPADGAPDDRAEELVGAVADLRVATVYADDDPRAGQWAATLAGRIGATHRVVADLATSDPAAARVAVETIADVHRGEHVLALVPAAWFPAVVSRLAPTAGGAAGTGPTVLECGDDGWFLRPWPGRPAGNDAADG
jgi:hypothetical protein